MHIEVIHNSKSIASESFRTLRSNIQFSNFGNIEYKMLLVDKSTIDVLPIEICKKDNKDNGGKTCYEINRSIQLYNIKALSTLGKFYYLETRDGVKFELDASKVILKQKQER